jgi:hypothetical protein
MCLCQEEKDLPGMASLDARNSINRRPRRRQSITPRRDHSLIALVLVRLDHVASVIINANHGIV